MKITIGFSRPKNHIFPIGSWLIRLYQWSSYSHVYLKFRSESMDRTLIYEAVGNGVRFVGSSVWEDHAVEVDAFDIEIADSSYKRLMQFCIDHAGIKYGYLQNIGIPLSRLLNLKKNVFRSGQNCSEIVADILAMEGYDFEMSHDLVCPVDIFRALSDQ